MRSWATDYNTQEDYVVVGPILTNQNCGAIGKRVEVPCYFYRTYLNMERLEAIGFILPHQSFSRPLQDYVVGCYGPVQNPLQVLISSIN